MKKKLFKIRFTLAFIVLLFAVVAVFGFYPIKFLNLEFSPSFVRILFDFSVGAAFAFIFGLVLALVFGRIYCSSLCPLGIVQEISALLNKNKKPFKNHKYKYFLAVIVFGCLIGGSTYLIRYVDPYSVFANGISGSIFGIIFLILVIIFAFLKDRYFCSNICPVGAVLGFISKFSLLKIQIDSKNCVSCGKCEKNCPTKCIDHKEKKVDNENCIKCFKCLNVCKMDAMNYKMTPKPEVEFSLKRRNLIFSAVGVVLLSGAIKTGIELSKNLGLKVKNLILPAGATDSNRMTNKCLNCNLCVNSCPNKIIQKANKDFSMVHIDYSKGLGFCKFDCVECSKVCPAGAIKKITLEEKQNTRIAMAVINDENCLKCLKCIDVCPKDAIKIENKKIVLDSTKCIGCGKCATICENNAIEIFSINKQRLV